MSRESRKTEAQLREELRLAKEKAKESERKCRSLGQSEMLYRTTIDDIDAGIHVIGSDRRIILVNEKFRAWCRELGLDQDLVGKTPIEAFPFLPGSVMEEYKTVFHTGVALRTVNETAVEDRLFATETRKLPIVEEGTVVRVVTIVWDVTEQNRERAERRRLETQMQQAQKLESLGVLAGGIAHDFNNLLMVIMGNADLVLHDLSAVAPARPRMEEIQKAARHAAELCTQMLAYSGRGRYEPQPLDLSELVAEMAHLLQVSIAKKTTLRYDCSKHLPPIEGDPTQLRQVVMNLITNASESLRGSDGAITIATGSTECDQTYLDTTTYHEEASPGRHTFVEVADTGCGMDKATLDRIFDPFFTTKFTGRGLGLAAALGIVRSHGGAINIDSEPGKGTCFRVLFPVYGTTNKQPHTDTAPSENWTATGTVLLVDDEAKIRTTGKLMLERFGLTVLTASDGEEALALFRDHAEEIVCVLLDLSMPRMDGAETFRRLKAVQKNLPVLLTSGHSEQEVAERFANEGLAGFMHKPYRMDKLKSALRKVLG